MGEDDNGRINASGEKKSALGTWAGGVAVVIFMFLLVFPGFLAGIFSKAGSVSLTNSQEIGYSNLGVTGPCAKIILFPAQKVMEHSPIFLRFYVWQYELVGGNEVWLDY